MIRYLLITGAIIVVVLGGLRVFYEYVLPHECEQNERFRGMQLATEPVKFTLREAIPEGDYVRSKFSSREAVKALVKPRIGVLNVQYYVDTLQSYLPQAEIVKLNSPGDFFEGRSEEFDALFLSAERGSVWTLIHPEFSVAIPQPDVLAAPRFRSPWHAMQRASRSLSMRGCVSSARIRQSTNSTSIGSRGAAPNRYNRGGP
jgi:hypothetical protein